MKKNPRMLSFIIFYVLIVSLFLLGTLIGNRAITVMSESRPYTNRHCLVIDAGHGGVDGGATSCSGVLESRINLEIALCMRDVFHMLGYDTRMIRETDVSIYTEGETIAAKKVSDLKQRVKTVNETDNAILVSIHQNYFPDGRYSGAQVFYSDNNESKLLAAQLQNNLVAALNPSSKRQAKKADGIYLMEHISGCGILVECGFLSNIEEESRLRDPIYQKQLSGVIAATISKFLDQ